MNKLMWIFHKPADEREEVLLKNASDDSEQEIEIPIRKVFLTPAETI